MPSSVVVKIVLDVHFRYVPMFLDDIFNILTVGCVCGRTSDSPGRVVIVLVSRLKE